MKHEARIMNKKGQRGFTLIELITAVSLFIIVMTISMGSILSIFDSNRQSRSIKSIMNNLNLSIESMSKEMRYGKNYHCGGGNVTTPQNCPSGDNTMSFLSSDGVQITYRINGPAIEKSTGGGSFVAVTSPDVVINSFTFFTLGAGSGDTLQPKVIIKIKGDAGTGKNQSTFTLQTMVSERALDI